MQPLEILTLIAPEFSTESEDLRKQYLQLADGEVTAKISGLARHRAVAALAAHYMTIGHKRRDGSREISSITEGEVSITYAKRDSGGAKNDLSTTDYGQTYKRLIRGYVMTPLTRMCI